MRLDTRDPNRHFRGPYYAGLTRLYEDADYAFYKGQRQFSVRAWDIEVIVEPEMAFEITDPAKGFADLLVFALKLKPEFVLELIKFKYNQGLRDGHQEKMDEIKEALGIK